MGFYTLQFQEQGDPAEHAATYWADRSQWIPNHAPSICATLTFMCWRLLAIANRPDAFGLDLVRHNHKYVYLNRQVEHALRQAPRRGETIAFINLDADSTAAGELRSHER